MPWKPSACGITEITAPGAGSCAVAATGVAPPIPADTATAAATIRQAETARIEYHPSTRHRAETARAQRTRRNESKLPREPAPTAGTRRGGPEL
ncbi:hypothetical protein NN3_31300 [Nocardia neocaledoniensis NBRC 108232]|nr:hypothetical protein NN3_31300 [Nocardia neocaledoniensis NBRC 108232]